MNKRTAKNAILQEYKVSGTYELLNFLIEKKVKKSRNATKSLLAHKQILVNGNIVTQHNQIVKNGDMVSIMKFNQARKERKLKGLKIVFEDEWLIVVEKESGLLSVSTDKEKIRTAYYVLNEYLRKKDKNARIFVLHRLDREISGLMVFAKNPDIQSMFQIEWDKIIPKYTYTAVVEGKINTPKGTVESWLSENKNLVMQYSFDEGNGLHAVTHYKTLKSTDRFSLLEYDLETKRKNQIRVHMKQIGHSIVGDKKYGSSQNPIKRIALHGSEMKLIHPMTKEIFDFKYLLPKRMLELVTDEKNHKISYKYRNNKDILTI